MSFTLTLKNNDTGEVHQEIELIAGGFFGVLPVSIGPYSQATAGGFGYNFATNLEMLSVYAAAVEAVIKSTEQGFADGQNQVLSMMERQSMAFVQLVDALVEKFGAEDAKAILHGLANSIKVPEETGDDNDDET